MPGHVPRPVPRSCLPETTAIPSPRRQRPRCQGPDASCRSTSGPRPEVAITHILRFHASTRSPPPPRSGGGVVGPLHDAKTLPPCTDLSVPKRSSTSPRFFGGGGRAPRARRGRPPGARHPRTVLPTPPVARRRPDPAPLLTSPRPPDDVRREWKFAFRARRFSERFPRSGPRAVQRHSAVPPRRQGLPGPPGTAPAPGQRDGPDSVRAAAPGDAGGAVWPGLFFAPSPPENQSPWTAPSPPAPVRRCCFPN